MKINTLHIAQFLGHSLPINLGHEISSTGEMMALGREKWSCTQPHCNSVFQVLTRCGHTLIICHPYNRQNVGFPHISVSPCCLGKKHLYLQSFPCQNMNVFTSLLRGTYLSCILSKFVDSNNFHFMLCNLSPPLEVS